MELLLVPSDLFRRLMAEYDSMRRFIFSLLSERLSSMKALVEGIIDVRLSDYLLEESEIGLLDTAHQEIANDLGTSREVVSRL